MLIPVLLFIVGLLCLIKGGDWFVDGATGIARRFHVPELLIGATVVSIGTTLPEVMVSTTSALTGHGEIAYGNAIGSVICNSAPAPYQRAKKQGERQQIFHSKTEIIRIMGTETKSAFSKLSRYPGPCIIRPARTPARARPIPAGDSRDSPVHREPGSRSSRARRDR